MELLTTKLTPPNPSPAEGKVHHLLLLALDAARQLDAAPLGRPADFEEVAVSLSGGAILLYETETLADGIGGPASRVVPAWGIMRLVRDPGDRETPATLDYEETCIKRGLGDAVLAVVLEIVGDAVAETLEAEAERAAGEDWADVEALEFEGRGEGGEFDYHASDLAFDAARERGRFGRRGL